MTSVQLITYHMELECAIVEIREISGYPNYRIGDDGSVWSCLNHAGNPTDKWVALNPHTEKNGYKRVLLSDNGKTKKYLIHRLVLETFIGPCPPGMEAFHFNNIRSDNRLVNLKWETRKNNLGHRENFGTVPRGITHGNAVFTEADVAEIIEKRRSGIPFKDLMFQYNASYSAIRGVVYGYTWKHLGIPSVTPRKGNYRRKWSTSSNEIQDS